MTDQQPIEKTYDPRAVEPEMYRLWEQSGAFESRPDGSPHARTFTIVIPPPNVTGALHLGHALNNTLQDILVRYHRMRGFNTLWQPGTDHAGIATQAVVERRIREQEGKTRFQLGATKEEAREELVRRIWQWKDEYEKRIISQLKLMGCSCDWGRNRFTLDEGMSRAVRHMFFKLFKDGLIFRGKRLVNWDTQLQTAVSDDEVYYETVKGHFWHIKYPVIKTDEATLDASRNGQAAPRSHEVEPSRNDPSRDRKRAVAASDEAMSSPPHHEGGPGRDSNEPEYVIIATTRPETMLGDTAVAVHPDPERFFGDQEARLRDEFQKTTGREQQAIKDKLEALAERRDTHLPLLTKLADMARAGRKVRLPLVEREIPLIVDEWADPTLGTGCVKITPAHDPNDYEVGLRHKLGMINVLTPEGRIAPTPENVNSEKYAGLAFSTDGRAKVVADLEAAGFIDHVEDRDIELGHSDRSKLPIEPYLSDQWFVKTAEATERHSDESTKGLADAAMEVVENGRIQVFPSRYAKSYLDWLGERRDWCISRQLWWGHRLSVWRGWAIPPDDSLPDNDPQRIALSRTFQINMLRRLLEAIGVAIDEYHIVESDSDPLEFRIYVRTSKCYQFLERLEPYNDIEGYPELRPIAQELELAQFDQDPDVLDTWFSSALWPFSTLGWPEETPHLKQYYPGSVLCTSRDIITNWVARMVMFGLYAMGEVPFDHVYIHPKILDGRGETMSKSKGNGVDPVDIIHTNGADALRYTLADMTTETQDIRMPVEYACPHCGTLIDQGAALKTEEQNRKSRGQKLERKLQPADITRIACTNKECGKPFATQWADTAAKQELGLARETSDKFEIGRNFCNKLWNAARYAFMNLERAADFSPRGLSDTPPAVGLLPEDRWILARLSQTIRRYHHLIAQYQFAASVKELRDFFWDSLCDWYIELTKARLSDEGGKASHEATKPRSDEGKDDGLNGGAHQNTVPGSPDYQTTQSESRETAQQVLAFCLDQVLRLWHPTIPFITERLWKQLNEIMPRRGLPGIVELKTDGPLISAEFPPVNAYPALDDEEILATFSALQDATRGVRDLRSASNVPPKERPAVTVVVPPDRLEAFRSQAHIVRHMAGIGELNPVDSGRRPPNAASMTLGALRIFIHDISDDAAERERATKALADAERQIAGKESKLSNEKFVANAKAEVVEAERQRLHELVTQRDTLKAHLAELEQ